MSKILLVEDEAPVREALALALEDEGFAVVQAHSAETGLEAFHQHDVDLLITDVQLPGRPGDWLVAQARGQGLYQGPALFITAGVRNPHLPDVEVLPKPVDLDVFIGKVRGKIPPARSPSPRVTLLLVLYVGRNTASARALEAVQRQLRSAPPGCSLRVVQLDGSAASQEEAERDRVTFAPTLVLRSAVTRAWAVGDAAIERNLESWLELSRHGSEVLSALDAYR